MDTLPRATHPSNHKWTEPTCIKVVELVCVTFERESLSSWAFVGSCCPLATEMSSTCVCVQLKVASVLWAAYIASWGGCGWRIHMFLLIYHSNLLWYVQALWTDTCEAALVFRFWRPNSPSCSPGPTFLITTCNCHNYAPPTHTPISPSVNDCMF